MLQVKDRGLIKVVVPEEEVRGILVFVFKGDRVVPDSIPTFLVVRVFFGQSFNDRGREVSTKHSLPVVVSSEEKFRILGRECADDRVMEEEEIVVRGKDREGWDIEVSRDSVTFKSFVGDKFHKKGSITEVIYSSRIE